MNSIAQQIIDEIGELPDLVQKNIKCHNENMTLIFLKSMIDENYLIEGVLRPIMDFNIKLVQKDFEDENEVVNLETLKKQILITSYIETLTEFSEIKKAVFSNKVLIFLMLHFVLNPCYKVKK